MDGKIIYNLFSATDPAAHAREKRPIAKYYSMNGVLPLEPHIDEIIGYMCKRLEDEFIVGPQAGKTCDLGQWLLFCKLFVFSDDRSSTIANTTP